MGNYFSETPAPPHAQTQTPQRQVVQTPSSPSKPQLSFEQLIQLNEQDLDSLGKELSLFFEDIQEIAKIVEREGDLKSINPSSVAKMQNLQKLYEERLTVIQLKVDGIALPSITVNGEKEFDENARAQRKQLIQRAEELIKLVTAVNLSEYNNNDNTNGGDINNEDNNDNKNSGDNDDSSNEEIISQTE